MPVAALVKDVKADRVQTGSSVFNVPPWTPHPSTPPTLPSNGLKPLSHSCRSAILSASACLHVQEILPARKWQASPATWHVRPLCSPSARFIPVGRRCAPLRSPSLPFARLVLVVQILLSRPVIAGSCRMFWVSSWIHPPPSPPGRASIAKEPTLLPSFL